MTFRSRWSLRRASSSSAVTAVGRVIAVATTVPAVRATTGSATPPGRVPTTYGSPPAGSSHRAAGASAGCSVSAGSGRAEVNSTSPAGVNTGEDSPVAPRVRRRREPPRPGRSPTARAGSGCRRGRGPTPLRRAGCRPGRARGRRRGGGAGTPGDRRKQSREEDHLSGGAALVSWRSSRDSRQQDQLAGRPAGLEILVGGAASASGYRCPIRTSRVPSATAAPLRPAR